jgi:hypothetical protein
MTINFLNTLYVGMDLPTLERIWYVEPSQRQTTLRQVALTLLSQFPHGVAAKFLIDNLVAAGSLSRAAASGCIQNLKISGLVKKQNGLWTLTEESG